MKNSANFHLKTWQSPNWDFDDMLLSEVENMWALMKNDAKIEEELTCQIKIDMRNLTNFDPSP